MVRSTYKHGVGVYLLGTSLRIRVPKLSPYPTQGLVEVGSGIQDLPSFVVKQLYIAPQETT